MIEMWIVIRKKVVRLHIKYHYLSWVTHPQREYMHVILESNKAMFCLLPA